MEYPKQKLGIVLKRAHEAVAIDPHSAYKQVTVRLFHKGVVLRGEKSGLAIHTTRQWLIRPGQVLLSRIDARNGAIGIVPPELDRAVVTNDFWAFDVNPEIALPRFLDAYFGTFDFVQACNAASEGTTNRVRLQPDRFLRIEVPLPSLDEQRRTVSRIDGFSCKVREIRKLRSETRAEQSRMLVAAYRKVIAGAESRLMDDVAPLVRRPVQVDPLAEYRELGIRSFGKGTFHKPPITGAMLGSKRIFRIEPGDLLFNIVFAWEGAVAVAQPQDRGRVGSHRFLTCVPVDGHILTPFLAFHFITDRGLEELGTASPGGAGRNRTLGIDALARIKVPVPAPERQRWFTSLLEKAEAANRLRIEVGTELDALMPSILSKAFRGEL